MNLQNVDVKQLYITLADNIPKNLYIAVQTPLYLMREQKEDWIMFYWLSSNDIQAKELELNLYSELNKKEFIYLTATQSIKRMRCASELLSALMHSKGEHPNIYTATEFIKAVSKPIYGEKGVLSNADQRYILAKVIRNFYQDNDTQYRAVYAMRYDLFDLFQALQFNNIPISSEVIQKIKIDYSQIEADIFQLYQSFCDVISGIISSDPNDFEKEAVLTVLGDTKTKANITYIERQKQAVVQSISGVKAIVFDGFLFLNEMQKFVLNEAIRQNKFVYFITKQFEDETGVFIFEEGIKEHIPAEIQIEKRSFPSERINTQTALGKVKDAFPYNFRAFLDSELLNDNSIQFITPFVGREEELRYVIRSISQRLESTYDGDISSLIRMVNEDLAIVVAVEKEKFEDRLSKLFREVGLFIFDKDLLAKTAFSEINISSIKPVYFTRNEYLDCDIKWNSGILLTYQEKLRLFEKAFQRIDINKYQRPISSYPVGQFVLEVYRLISEGISISGFKSILYSNWRYIISEQEQDKWSDSLASFRFIEPYLEGKTNLSEWIEILADLLLLKSEIKDDPLYNYHPLKAIPESHLKTIYKLMLHLSDMVSAIESVNGDINKHLDILQKVIMNAEDIFNHDHEKLEFEEIVLKRLSLAVKEIGSNSLIPEMEANYFAQNICSMLTEWENENCSESESILQLNVVNLENVKHFKYSYFIMCEASKYPRRYYERFPYTLEIQEILGSPKYKIGYTPQILKGIDYHLQLERYLFKNVLDFTSESITFTYCEKENDNHNRPSVFLDDIVAAFGVDIPFVSTNQPGTVLDAEGSKSEHLYFERKQKYTLTEMAYFKLCPRLYYHLESDELKGVYATKHQLKFYFEAILFCDLFNRFMHYNLKNKKVYRKQTGEYRKILDFLWPGCIAFHSRLFSFFNEYEKRDIYRNAFEKVCLSIEKSEQYIIGERYTVISYKHKDYSGKDYVLTVEHDNRVVDYDKKTWRMSQNSIYLHFLVLKTSDNKINMTHYADMISALDSNDQNEDRINLMSRIIAKINIQFDSKRYVNDGIARTDALVDEISNYNFANAASMPSEYCNYCRYSETCVGI